MILTLTASIMYWCMQQASEDSDCSEMSMDDAFPQKAPSGLSTDDLTSQKTPSEVFADDATSQKYPSSDGEDGSVAAENISNLTTDDASSDTSQVENGVTSVVE